MITGIIIYFIGLCFATFFAALFYSGPKEVITFAFTYLFPPMEKEKTITINIKSFYPIALSSWIGCVLMLIDRNFYWKKWNMFYWQDWITWKRFMLI